MSKLYVFGIGGTGSRVLKSLTMLFASGVQLQNNFNEIVPIIIDPDYGAADLMRTIELMRRYRNIRNEIEFNTGNPNQFFKMIINLDILPDVNIQLKNSEDEKFGEFIGLGSMSSSEDKPNKALAQMLFSEHNLDANMDVGFKGNPNIGSVVLNQFTNSQDFIDFANSFQDGDRIFVISSIFGGTGASGFPLLMKNLRAIPSDMPGSRFIKNAPIGAITVLPYFNIEKEEENEIDSSTFISKTKAALAYYDKNLNETNALYYIGDKISKTIEYSVGGNTQQNDAHFVELAAALAIVDFAAIPDVQLEVNDGVPAQPVYKEFGIKSDTERITFQDLGDQSREIIKKPLLQFILFTKYIREQIEQVKSKKSTWAKEHNFDDNFYHANFYASDLLGVQNSFWEWLTEMHNNKRAFSPFNLNVNKQHLFALISEEKPKNSLFPLARNYALFDLYLNKESRNIKKGAKKESNFIRLFYQATNGLINKKFR